MSVLSIQNPPVGSLNIVQLPIENRRDYSTELQAAFEELDVHQICSLLEMGANPYQKIDLNEKISFALLKRKFKTSFDVEALTDQINSLSVEDALNKVENKELANRIIEMKSLLENDPLSVSDEELIDFAAALYTEFANHNQAGMLPKISVMALALTLQNFGLIHKLVDAGFNFSDPKALDTLRGYEYVVTASNLENNQDGLQSISYVVGLPAYAIDPNSPKLSVEEVFEKVQSLSFDNSLDDSAQALLELKRQGRPIEVKYKQLPILGTITDFSDAHIAMQSYDQIIDFLLEQGVPREKILSFEDALLENPQHAVGNSAVIKFFLSRGFEIPNSDEITNYLKPWKNCWDPRTWNLKG
ncbi:MAG: hypothetical protein S4CHLAM6_15100 [Chlamydiae bacterium]|nr:hypothetical protein [Chlamydiota bacterium]